MIKDDLVVVGAGVVGVTTALLLQEKFPNKQVISSIKTKSALKTRAKATLLSI